jgi:hypothetical protein
MTPVMTRKDEIREFLDSINAELICEARHKTGAFRMYVDEDGIGFVIEFTGHPDSEQDFSWDAYVPATADGRAQQTFQAIKKQLAKIRDNQL